VGRGWWNGRPTVLEWSSKSNIHAQILKQSKVRSFDAESTKKTAIGKGGWWNRRLEFLLLGRGWWNCRPSLLEWSTYRDGMVEWERQRHTSPKTEQRCVCSFDAESRKTTCEELRPEWSAWRRDDWFELYQQLGCARDQLSTMRPWHGRSLDLYSSPRIECLQHCYQMVISFRPADTMFVDPEVLNPEV